MTFYNLFCAELDKVTIKADMPAAAAVGECLRAAKRVQNAIDDALTDTTGNDAIDNRDSRRLGAHGSAESTHHTSHQQEHR